LLPRLYLEGVSTGDFSEALTTLLGKDAPGLSAATISRLKTVWQDEYKKWQQRDRSKKRYVYFWADGIYCNVRMVVRIYPYHPSFENCRDLIVRNATFLTVFRDTTWVESSLIRL
jgi:hypothetical protein